MKTTKSNAGRVTDDYFKLVKAFPLRRIRTREEQAAAAKIFGRLTGRPDGEMTAGEDEYATALGILIRDYDERVRPMPPEKVPPVEAVRFFMDQHGMNTNDLGKVIGSQAAASFVLTGKRELSKNHIRRLAERFNVSPALFI